MSVRDLLPAHLSQDQAQGLVRAEPVAQFEIGDMENFVYLILDWDSREAAIVDPRQELDAPLRALEENGFALKSILLTHSHHDHVGGVPELLKRFPGIPLILHERDLHRIQRFPDVARRFKSVKDSEEIQVGSISVQCLHTPGHSAGEISYFFHPGGRRYLLTGDTIFIRDCGRTDLPTGSNEELFETLQRVKKLPAETIILPGHHYARECASTIAAEMRESAPFRCTSVEELASLP